MEKEMKKLLLVAVSVGVFLLVTITISIIMLTPKAQTREAAVSSYSQGRVQPATDYFNAPPAITGQETVMPIIVIPENVYTAPPVDFNNGENLTIQIPIPSTAPVPVTPAASAPVRVVTTPAPAEPSRTATSTAAAPAATTATTVTTAPRPAAIRTTIDYWIQIGAYSAMVRAEDVKEFLASKGLISIIENREVSGDNLYRVRLGPYTSEREANHWLAIVREIEGFSDSQVRQTTRQQ